MAAEVTCVWTHPMAEQLFHGCELQLAQAMSMRAEAGAKGMSKELCGELDKAVEAIKTEMASLVKDFAMPAVVVDRGTVIEPIN